MTCAIKPPKHAAVACYIRTVARVLRVLITHCLRCPGGAGPRLTGVLGVLQRVSFLGVFRVKP